MSNRVGRSEYTAVINRTLRYVQAIKRTFNNDNLLLKKASNILTCISTIV